MSRFLYQVAVAVLIAGFVAAPAAAQFFNSPVTTSPKAPTGVTIGVEYGRGLNTDSDKNTLLAGRLSLGLPLITLTGGVGTFEVAGADDEIQFMGQLGLRVFGGPLMPVSVNLFGGAGYASVGGVSNVNIPIGLGIALDVPTPGASVEPWVAPRLQLGYQGSVAGPVAALESVFRGGYGVSAGVTLGIPMGLGLSVAVDWSHVGEKSVTGLAAPLPVQEPLLFGVRVHYTFGLPGVPIVPVM